MSIFKNGTTPTKLFSFWTSSTSWRIRILLGLKGVQYDYVSLDELSQELKGERFKRINPAGILPALYINDKFLTESMAIAEYLEELYPSVKFFF